MGGLEWDKTRGLALRRGYGMGVRAGWGTLHSRAGQGRAGQGRAGVSRGEQARMGGGGGGTRRA